VSVRQPLRLLSGVTNLTVATSVVARASRGRDAVAVEDRQVPGAVALEARLIEVCRGLVDAFEHGELQGRQESLACR
jgi:hypothetical protein